METSEGPATNTSPEDPTELVGGVAADDEENVLTPGAQVGRYVVIRVLGEGGMGRVYLADDPELDRRVAIKILRALSRHPKRAEQARARLMREAQAIARLSHPNVVAVFDVGRYAEGVFVAMEYVDGVSLTAWLAAESRPLDEILDVFIEVARGLEVAHEADLVHRDIKPDNIHIDGKGRVKLLDFGIARASIESLQRRTSGASVSDESGEASLLSAAVTTHGLVLGTPAYMSPEQAAGTTVTSASDQFSYCCTLFEAVLGQRPFEGRTLPALVEARNRGPAFPDRPIIVTALRQLLLRGLAVEPADRFGSMRALRQAVEHVRFRGRRVARIAAAVGAAALAGLAVAVRGDDQSCRDVETLEAWNAERRAAVQSQVDGLGAESAAQWAIAAEAIDGFAQRWRRARVDVCDATVHGNQPGAVMDLRLACLDRHAQSLSALLHTIASGDGGVTATAPSLVAQLPTPDECADTRALRLLPPVPIDADRRAAVFEIRQRLAGAQALRRTGDFAIAQARLDDVAALVAALEEPPVDAELALEQALLFAALGKHADAVDSLRAGLGAAESVPYPLVRAEIGVALVESLGAGLKRFEAAAEAMATTEAVIDGLGRPERLVARIDLAHSDLLIARGRHHEAQKIIEGVLELEHPDIPRDVLLERLATTLSRDVEAKRARLHEVLDLRRERYGPNHPGVAEALAGLAATWAVRGPYDKARTYLDEAMAIQRRAFGAESIPVARIHRLLGVVAIRSEDYPTALTQLETAERIANAHPDQPDFELTGILSNMAVVHSRQGRHEQALEMHHRSLDIIERTDPDHPDRVIPYINIATTLSRQERYPEAIEWYEKAAALLSSTPDQIARAGDMMRAIGDIRLQLRQYGRARDALLRASTFYQQQERTHPSVNAIEAMVGLGYAQLRLGHHDEAIETVERALAELDEHGSNAPGPVFALARFTLARGLEAAGRDRAGAVELVQRARNDVEGTDADDLRAEIDGWLHEHGATGRRGGSSQSDPDHGAPVEDWRPPDGSG